MRGWQRNRQSQRQRGESVTSLFEKERPGCEALSTGASTLRVRGRACALRSDATYVSGDESVLKYADDLVLLADVVHVAGAAADRERTCQLEGRRGAGGRVGSSTPRNHGHAAKPHANALFLHPRHGALFTLGGTVNLHRS